MKLSGLLRLLRPTTLLGKTVLFGLLPVFLLTFTVLWLFLYNELALLRNSINESLAFHTQAVAAALGRRFSACETMLRAFASRADVRALMFSRQMRDLPGGASVLTALRSEVSSVFPGAVSVFVTVGDQLILIPPAPKDSELASSDWEKALPPGFSWSEPLTWSPGRSVVAACWKVRRKDGSSGSVGIVLSVDGFASGTSEMNLLLTDALGFLVVDKSSGACWFARSTRPPSESAPGFPSDDEGLESLTLAAVSSPAFPQRFRFPNGDAVLFCKPLDSGDLALGVLYDAKRLDGPVSAQRAVILLLGLFLFLLFTAFGAVVYKTVRSSLNDLSAAVETLRLYGDMPEPPASLSEEFHRPWEELASFASEIRRREHLAADSSSSYRFLLEKTRELISAMPDGYLLSREDGAVVESNPSIRALSGYGEEELLKMKVDDLFVSEPDGAFLKRKDGTLVKVSVLQRKVALNYEDHVIRIVKDVTREEELRTSLLKKSDEFERQVLEIKNQVREYRLAARKFVDRLLEGVVRMDCAGNILECNPAAARLFRYPASDELIGVNFFADLRLDDHSSPGLADFLEGAPLNEPVEVSFTAFDGSRVHALVSCAWVDERKRDMAEFLLLDLSEAHRLRSDLAALRRETEYILREHEEELKRTQQQLIDHAHRAGMAVVASEVLHNIGNAVNSIGIRLRELADLLEREKVPERLSLLAEKQSGAPDSQDSIQRYVAMLARAVESSRERLRSNVEFIAGKLSHISEIISLQQSIASIRGIIEEVKVTDLILDAVEMNREVMEKRGIVVTYRFADIPPIKVEKNKLLQVLVNLIKNAVEAIDMAGPEARKEITVGVAPSQDGSQVVITVTDTGIGMTEEVLANLFSFGYTTKRDRGGSGFGLHSSSNLLKAMGGSLSARSDGPGKGAVFTVTVPLEPRIEGNGGA